MAKDEHVAILKQGVEAWNAWRAENPDIRPDLSGADLWKIGVTLVQANLSGANLSRANLTLEGLDFANLSNAELIDAQGRLRALPSFGICYTNFHISEPG
jgi:hypothetical protein